MVRGAEERLREYRRLLPGGDRAGALDGRFWDAVVLTAANDRQAETYVQQLDALHVRGQLPGARERYLVIPDPPGPRVGSGGATLHVMLRLQAVAGSGWSAKKLFLLHAGGYSERSPAHGTLGKAFGQLPFDAAGVGVPATVLEAQLVSFQELPSRLPNGVFVSSADVAVQFGSLPRLGPDTVARPRWGRGSGAIRWLWARTPSRELGPDALAGACFRATSCSTARSAASPRARLRYTQPSAGRRRRPGA